MQKMVVHNTSLIQKMVHTNIQWCILWLHILVHVGYAECVEHCPAQPHEDLRQDEHIQVAGILL